MKKTGISKWLKGITIAVALMGAVFFLMIVPIMANSMKIMYPEAAGLFIPGLLYSGVIAIGCYAVLGEFWGICMEIGKDNSFSMENVRHFMRMSRIAFGMALIWFAGMVFLVVTGWIQPAILIFMLLAIFISIVLAILTAALAHLVEKAYDMKQENELTI